MAELISELRSLYRHLLWRDLDENAEEFYLPLLQSGAMEFKEIEEQIKSSTEFSDRHASKAIWDHYFDTVLKNKFARDHIVDVSFDSPNIAVIVESRNDPHLKSVVYNTMEKLGASWGLQIFHCNRNKGLVRNIASSIPNAHIVELGVDRLDWRKSGQLEKSKAFWDLVKGDKILFFQTDTIIRKSNTDMFLAYDYIGAPWGRTNMYSGTLVGNGGLSLRTRSVMLEIASRYEDDSLPADVFFSKYCHIDGYNIAPVEVAKRFSVENVYDPDPFGLHKSYFELKPDQLRSLLQCD